MPSNLPQSQSTDLKALVLLSVCSHYFPYPEQEYMMWGLLQLTQEEVCRVSRYL